eukprot:5935641-Amphidinium_carterae.1
MFDFGVNLIAMDCCALMRRSQPRLCVSEHLNSAIYVPSQPVSAGDPASFHVGWVRTLQRLYTDANVCPAMEPMLRSVVARLSESIDTALAREDRAEQIRGTTLLRNAGSNKRLRIDEDLKAFLAVGQTQSKQSRSSAEAVRTSGIYHGDVPGNTRDWSIVSIAYDSKRLGKPAEETVVYAIYSPESGLAAWLPVVPVSCFLRHYVQMLAFFV